MADPEVLVVSVGMMTSVGLSAAETAASVRAATMRFTEVDWRDHRFEPFTIAEVPEDGLPDLTGPLEKEMGLTNRETRMLRLGTAPLIECLAPVLSGLPRPALILALPDSETTRPLDRPAFLRRFEQQVPGAFDLEKSACEVKGRAGGLMAIGQAGERIRSGAADFVLAGGIDTYRDLYILGTFDRDGRVKSSKHLDGFVPGEGAAFLLLAGRKAAETAGLTPMARLLPMAQGFEEGHLYSDKPYRGDGLAATFEAFFKTVTLERPIQTVYSSMTGESHWAKEWGVAFMRNRSAFNPTHAMHHPADCVGETGAAAGPLMAALGAIGIARGTVQSPCLVYCSSDRGDRAVLALIAP